MAPPSEIRRASRPNLGGANGAKLIPILPAETSRPPAVQPLKVRSKEPQGPPTQKPIGFHFVNLTDPAIDTKTRKSINIHVQRVDRQKKRWERIKRPLENRESFPAALRPTPCRCSHSSSDGPNISVVARGTKHGKICSTCGGSLPAVGNALSLGNGRDLARRRGGKRNLNVLLGQGRTDPFLTYPVETQPDMDMLVDFFAQFIVPQHLAFGEKQNSPYLTQVVPTSLSDPAPFHGLLLSAAFYMFQATQQMKWAHMGFFHLGAGIKAINKSLGDPKRAVTNANITGVMYLVAFELANGDHAACKYHMDGLLHMVELRGGLDNAHFGFLRNQIMWADRMAATLLGIKPYFSPLLLSSKSSPSSDPDLTTPESPPIPNTSLNPGFKSFFSKGPPRPEAVKALSMLCEKVAILSTTNDSKIWMKNIGPFSENNIEFEYLLLQAPDEPITLMTDFEAIEECCRVAALQFFTALNEERPSESGMIQSLGAQLKDRFELLHHSTCLQAYGEEMLWIVLGGSYRVRGTLRSWFAEQLPAIYHRLGIETWEDCLKMLKKFLWLDRIAQPSQDLWTLSKGRS